MSKGLKRLNDSGRIDIPEILFNVPGTIVDWDIYDDATSPDGGAWRKKTAHTSWYNEPLNTATRGSTREFPARALVTAETAKVTIWDITSGQPEMWMVFNAGIDNSLLTSNASGVISSVCMLGSVLCVGQSVGSINDAAAGLSVIDLVADTGARYGVSGYGHGKWVGSLVNTSTPSGYTGFNASYTLINNIVNSVAITYLPDAPLDEYGMRVPTIAVGTGTTTTGGIQVIYDNATIGNASNTGLSSVASVDLVKGVLMYHTYAGLLEISDISNRPATFTLHDYYNQSIPALSGGVGSGFALAVAGRYSLTYVSGGLNILYENSTTPANGMVAYLTNTYNTGWMVGDIRRAYLCNSLTADHSVKGGTLTMTGTVTETVNAGGVNYYASSTNSDFLTEAYSADLDFGVGDFCVIGWAFTNGQGTSRLIDRSDADGSHRLLFMVNGGKAELYTSGAINTQSYLLSTTLSSGWHLICGVRIGGTLTLYVDGAPSALLAALAPGAGYDITSLSGTGTLTVNGKFDGAGAGGQLGRCLLRISATAPTPEQIKHMYETERKLFEPGSQALLSSSPSVSDLRYDKTTDLYAVTNGTNTDVFKDLTRIDSAATGSKLNAPITTMSGNTLIAPAENVASSIRAIGVKQPKTVLLDFNVAVNGKFSTTSGWTLGAGWSIVGGQLVATAAASTVSVVMSGIITSNKSYVQTYTVSSFTSGTITTIVGGAFSTNRASIGTYTETIVAGVFTNLQIYTPVNGTSAAIDNFSLRESTSTLPKGFKPKKVWAGGLLQELGTDYDITFDGFLYGVNFFIEPATNVQVEGEYI